MKYSKKPINRVKNIALVAHDHKKEELLDWAKFNKKTLQSHNLFATGTTGKMLEEVLETNVHKFQSGPLGGDQQIGSHIAEGKLDMLFFFWDPLESQPHDSDVKALLRISQVWNIPIACNRASADFLISSTLMDAKYDRLLIDYSDYKNRKIK